VLSSGLLSGCSIGHEVRGGVSADIFSGQPSSPDQLAALYDLEHDAVTEDLDFYREMARRTAGATVDLGCGSGRLFASLVAGGAGPLLGVDGSPALLARAERRISATPLLRDAAAAGRLELVRADVRRLDAIGRPAASSASLIVAAGVLPHMDGPEEALSMLGGVRRLLAPDGVLVLDDVGPGALPDRDLPLSVDWRGALDGRPVVRRSQLMRRDAPEGLRVVFSTLVDIGQADGTISRVPASYRLWYPRMEALTALLREADLAVELTYGSHELEPLDMTSDRRLVVARRATGRER
jgi:SAM-dependent methyltransferase